MSDNAELWATSKVWPADRTKTIAALVFPNAEAGDENTIYYDIDIVLIDTGSGKLLARNLRKRATFSDAFKFNGIAIDTAPYNLAKGTRAFGIRRSYSGSSSVNPASMTVMELYTMSGTKLKIVSDPFIIGHAYGEWDQNCAGQFTDIARTIGIKRTATRGYNDLEVTTAQQDKTSVKKGEDCAEETRAAPKK